MKRPLRFPKGKAVSIGASIVALAAVILVGSALTSPKRPPAQKAPSPELSAQALATRASDAASNGETQAALSLAKQALQADARNADARQVLDSLEAPQPDAAADKETGAGSPDSTKPPSAGIYASVVKDSTKLLPAKFSDWVVGRVTSGEGQSVVTFEPKPTSSNGQGVTRGAIYAIDAGSSKKAEEYSATLGKRVYPLNRATLDVGAVDRAGFGTDSSRTAAVTFMRGRYVFEVIVTAAPGTKPVTLKPTVAALAAAVPAAR